VTLHGHAHPEIAEAIARQAQTLEQVIFAGFTHAPAAQLATELVRVLPPGLSRVFFSDDGSTAVEAGIKIALQWWHNRGESRRLVLALDRAYHGDTFRRDERRRARRLLRPVRRHLFEVAHLPDPSVDRGHAPGVRPLLDARGRDVAALVVEPLVLGAGGMRMWSADHPRRPRRPLPGRRRPARRRRGDDRLRAYRPLSPASTPASRPTSSASQGDHRGFLPLGATVTTERLFEGFLAEDRRRTLFHGHSYTANPIACAAALASLELLERPACTRPARASSRRIAGTSIGSPTTRACAMRGCWAL
jgi:adenosylmethionine-8-amino-7-oxononanoate aminotransferase